jgi:hypothetical protein
MVESYYETLKNEAAVLKVVLQFRERDYNEAVDTLVQYQDSQESDKVAPPEDNEVEIGPSEFSSFADKAGYAGRFLSKYRIDSIVSLVFHHRRQYQDLKMRGLSACLLKIAIHSPFTFATQGPRRD